MYRHSVAITLVALAGVLSMAMAQAVDAARRTETPIEHLIVIVGENISFDNLFATYMPPRGQSVGNLLSRGIVDKNGGPGPRFANAVQRIANVRDHYAVTPPTAGAFAFLPQPGTTYATGLSRGARDVRFPADLPNGPYRITRYAAYHSPVGDPVHRFFQMWQQINGGKHDLFTWVGVSDVSRQRDDPFLGENQGGVAMGFYSMSSGDAPYFRELAENYALADNYHQPIMGGTAANFLALSTGYVGVYLGVGESAIPPQNQVEDPDPRLGTNNSYKRWGAYTACADDDQPGVKAVRAYLATLPYKPFKNGNCALGTYYLINNYEPGYAFDGTPRALGPQSYTLPPQAAANIGTLLATNHISWKWYSGGRTAAGIDKGLYCSICDPLTHSTAVMTSELRANLQSLQNLMHDLDAKTLPSVSFVIPPNPESGHPAYSTVAAFERFVKEVVTKVQGVPAIWNKTAILVTTDEGGGYYDSGYVQILDFFGDGTRIPFLVVSPFARKGHIDHTYYDHVSILKFIERNWRLPTLSERSRDNLPNPVMSGSDPYVPVNRPAIGDLMNLFKF